MNTQLKKGALELCVLARLTGGDRYGYELTDEISEKMTIAPGTLYLILKRLKDDDMVETYLRESESGPARKYYKLTEKGHVKFDEMKAEWQEFTKTVDEIINMGGTL